MYKVLTALALFALVGPLAAEDCSCDQMKEIEELRKFLALPLSLETTTYPVVPGELSPYICNCEKNIAKRDAFNRVHRNSNPFVRNKCPSGFRRLFRMCVRV